MRWVAMRRTERLAVLARFVGKKGLTDPSLLSLLGDREYYREVKTCAKGGASLSVGLLGVPEEEATGMVTLTRFKGKARVVLYLRSGDGFARESLRHVSDVIFEIAPSFKRIYVVRSPNYEGIPVADKLWRWLWAGHSPRGPVYYLEISASGRLRKKLETLALRSGAFVRNRCLERLETNVIKKQEELQRFEKETRVWADSLSLCKFDGSCYPMRDVLR